MLPQAPPLVYLVWSARMVEIGRGITLPSLGVFGLVDRLVRVGSMATPVGKDW
jgi:hypothetical protein